MPPIRTITEVYDRLSIETSLHFIDGMDYLFPRYIKTIRLLRIRMKRRRNTIDKNMKCAKKLNKNPSWLWKREISGK